MVGEASVAGFLEAGLAGFADDGDSTVVFVIRDDVADPGVEADAVVVGADDGQLGPQEGRVGDAEAWEATRL